MGEGWSAGQERHGRRLRCWVRGDIDDGYAAGLKGVGLLGGREVDSEVEKGCATGRDIDEDCAAGLATRRERVGLLGGRGLCCWVDDGCAAG